MNLTRTAIQKYLTGFRGYAQLFQPATRDYDANRTQLVCTRIGTLGVLRYDRGNASFPYKERLHAEYCVWRDHRDWRYTP